MGRRKLLAIGDWRIFPIEMPIRKWALWGFLGLLGRLVVFLSVFLNYFLLLGGIQFPVELPRALIKVRDGIQLQIKFGD
jgi:hypothetical protein